MYREVFVPVDNSQHSDWAVDRAIELAQLTKGRVTANHVYAARLHDVRFRQLETGLPAQFQTPEEIKRQRKIHDKLIEKGLQLIADSFLDQVGNRCDKAGVDLTRQLLEGIRGTTAATRPAATCSSAPTAGSWRRTRTRPESSSAPRGASTT